MHRGHTCVVSLQVMHSLTVIMRKHPTKRNGGTIYQITQTILKKYQGHER